MRDMNYADAVKNAEHLKAIGQTTVYLYKPDFPWAKAVDVEEGGSIRLSGPTGFYVLAKENGLTFKWPVDFEGRDANGRGVSMFERGRLRETINLLPPAAREKLGVFLAEKVLPALEKRTREIYDALNMQADSEDCVRGLIAFCEHK